MSYNGWANRATWNVMLWLQNDESLCHEAVKYVSTCRKNGREVTYKGLLGFLAIEAGERTPDGVLWRSREVNREEVREALLTMYA